MKISVVIPVYNVMLYLERCVQSVIRQTYKDFISKDNVVQVAL